MPIDGALNGGSPQAGATPVEPTPAPSAPSSAPSPAPTPSAAPSSAPSQGAARTVPGAAVAAPTATVSPGTPASPFNLREFANQHIPGVQTRYQSDADLAKELIQAAIQAQRSQPYAQMGERFAPHAQQFEQWLAEQEKAKAAQAAQQTQNWWQPPEYDPAWEKGVIVDPATGRLVPLPGNPVDLPARIEKYREFQRDMLHKLTKDPVGMMKDGLMPMIQQEAQRIVQEQLATVQANQYAQGYVGQNLGWLAQKDAQGQPMRHPNGMPVLSPVGERFNHYVKQLQASGLRDPQMQAQVAERMVMGDLAALQVQQPGQSQQQQAPQQQQLPAFGTPSNAPNYGNAPAERPGQSLKDMMWDAFQGAGIASRPTNAL